MTTTDPERITTMNPKIRQCAAALARQFHDASERKRCPVEAERYDWNELADAERDLMVDAFCSLIHGGAIVCPVLEHRIGIDFREEVPW